MTINGDVYNVVDTQFNHVWNTQDLFIPFHIDEVDAENVFFDPNGYELLSQRPTPNNRNPFPDLVFYANDGVTNNQQRINEHNAHPDGRLWIYTRDLRSLTLTWYWPNTGNPDMGDIPSPTIIGQMYHADRN